MYLPTENLLVRDWDPGEEKELFEAKTDPDIVEGVGDWFKEFYTIYDAFTDISDNHQDGCSRFAIIKENIIVGGLESCCRILKGYKNTEIAFWVKNAYRGNKIAAEAAKAYIDKLFNKEIYRVEAKVSDWNMPSIKTLEEIGFKRVRTYPYHESRLYVHKNFSTHEYHMINPLFL